MPCIRNLKDEQIKAIAKNGGAIQVNFYSGFLDSNYSKGIKVFLANHKKEYDSLAHYLTDYTINQLFSKKYPQEIPPRPPLSVLIDHIDYIVKLVEQTMLAWDQISTEWNQHRWGWTECRISTHHRSIIERGYSKKDVNKFLGGNFIRVFKANQ